MQGTQFERVEIFGGAAGVVADAVVHIAVEFPQSGYGGDVGFADASKQSGLPVVDRPAPLCQQLAGVVVPAVGCSRQSEFPVVTMLPPEPIEIVFGTDGAEFLADPGIDRRGRQGIGAAPARQPVLERYRRVESAELQARTPAIHWKWPDLRVGLGQIHQTA